MPARGLDGPGEPTCHPSSSSMRVRVRLWLEIRAWISSRPTSSSSSMAAASAATRMVGVAPGSKRRPSRWKRSSEQEHAVRLALHVEPSGEHRSQTGAELGGGDHDAQPLRGEQPLVPVRHQGVDVRAPGRCRPARPDPGWRPAPRGCRGRCAASASSATGATQPVWNATQDSPSTLTGGVRSGSTVSSSTRPSGAGKRRTSTPSCCERRYGATLAAKSSSPTSTASPGPRSEPLGHQREPLGGGAHQRHVLGPARHQVGGEGAHRHLGLEPVPPVGGAHCFQLGDAPPHRLGHGRGQRRHGRVVEVEAALPHGKLGQPPVQVQRHAREYSPSARPARGERERGRGRGEGTGDKGTHGGGTRAGCDRHATRLRGTATELRPQVRRRRALSTSKTPPLGLRGRRRPCAVGHLECQE